MYNGFVWQIRIYFCKVAHLFSRIEKIWQNTFPHSSGWELLQETKLTLLSCVPWEDLTLAAVVIFLMGISVLSQDKPSLKLDGFYFILFLVH